MSTHPGQVINRFNFMEIVYPLNRKATCVLPAFESEDEDEGDNDSVESIAMRQGLSFIPLYIKSSMSFSSNELLKFQRRYENGYDLKHDIRYNA